MAATFLAPTATCSLVGASAADVAGYCWFGLSAALDVAACCAFYAGSGTGDRHLWTLSASKGTTTPMAGPFLTSDCAIYAQVSGTRASALISSASTL